LHSYAVARTLAEGHADLPPAGDSKYPLSTVTVPVTNQLAFIRSEVDGHAAHAYACDMLLPVRKTLRVKYLAAEIHALLFISMWLLYSIFSQPLMNGPSAVPFIVLFIADLPISVIAFAVMFTSIKMGPVAALAWGVLGTLWWFAIGIAINRRIRSYRENRAGPTKLFPATTDADSQVIPNARKELLIAAGVVAVVLIASVAGKWHGGQGHFDRGEIRSFSFAPDERSVVLVRSLNDSSSRLEKITLNSGAPAQVGAPLPCMASSPTYSPDGTRVAFACGTKASGLSRILIMDADGRNLHPLFSANSDNYDFAPHFAPDGNEIYFGRVLSFIKDTGSGGAPPRRWDLYSASLDGTNERQLTDRHFEDFGISFSADGRTFVISGDVGSGTRVKLCSLDNPGKSANAIPVGIPNGARSPVISNVSLASDGQSVYFMAASDGKKGFDYDVYRANLAGNDVEKFTSANGYATDLAVSADGKTAVFLKWTSRWGSLPNLSKLYALDMATKRATPLNVTGGH
jgi:WD40-like Beta Propeller Repeat